MKWGHKIQLTLSNLVSIFAAHFLSLQNFCSMIRMKGCLIVYVSISRSKESEQRHFSRPYEQLQKVLFFSFAFKPESRKELSRKLQSWSYQVTIPFTTFNIKVLEKLYHFQTIIFSQYYNFLKP